MRVKYMYKDKGKSSRNLEINVTPVWPIFFTVFKVTLPDACKGLEKTFQFLVKKSLEFVNSRILFQLQQILKIQKKENLTRHFDEYNKNLNSMQDKRPN